MTENRLAVKANSGETVPFFSFEESGEFNFENATKVLSVTASACVTDCVAADGEIKAYVRTVFRAVYSTDDGFESEETTVDSVQTIAVAQATNDTDCFMRATVEDCVFSGTKTVKAKADVRLSGWYIQEKTWSLLDVNQEDVHTKSVTLNVENASMLPISKLTVTSSNEARVPISEICDYYAVAWVNNVYPAKGSYQIEGEISVKLLALNDSGQFTGQSFSVPYNTEIADENVDENSRLDVGVTVCSVVLTLAEGDGRTVISDVALTFCGTVTTEQTVQGLLDAYSTTNELSIEKESCVFNSGFCLRAVRDKVTETVKVSDGVSEVCGVVGICGEAEAVHNDGNTQAEGLLRATVIYVNENDVHTSVRVEMPYTVIVSKEYGCDIDFVPTLIVSNAAARVRTTQEIEVSVEFIAVLRGKKEFSAELVREMTFVGEKADDGATMVLYIVKQGESLWDVGKELNTEEATLIELNPDLKTPLKGGERILLYRELSDNY